jgi:hypothetical protein
MHIFITKIISNYYIYKKIKMMTTLKFVNKFILQWFGVRLTKCTEIIQLPYSIHKHSVDENAEDVSDWIDITQTNEWYSIQYFILPLSGWGNDFIYLTSEPKFIRISKIKSFTNEE